MQSSISCVMSKSTIIRAKCLNIFEVVASSRDKILLIAEANVKMIFTLKY